MDIKLQLIERVAQQTSGTVGDPLSHDEVQQVVEATLKVVRAEPDLFVPLFLNRD